jgi:heme exporter protein B
MGLVRFFCSMVLRDLLLSWRQRGDVLVGLMFFALVATLFPLAVGPEPAGLLRIGPGVLWVAALLANLLALPRLFHGDWQDGSLELLLLTPFPSSIMVAGKMMAHWLSTSIPLALAAPLLGIQYGLPSEQWLMLLVSLLIGTPIITTLGGVGAALTLGLRQGEVLLALVLIFGCGAVAAVAAGQGGVAELSLLAALACASIFCAPWLAAKALRLAIE